MGRTSEWTMLLHFWYVWNKAWWKRLNLKTTTKSGSKDRYGQIWNCGERTGPFGVQWFYNPVTILPLKALQPSSSRRRRHAESTAEADRDRDGRWGIEKQHVQDLRQQNPIFYCKVLSVKRYILCGFGYFYCKILSFIVKSISVKRYMLCGTVHTCKILQLKIR